MLDETQPPECPRQLGPSSRTFTVCDMMIVVAAVAVGVLGYRANNATMIERGYAWGEERTIKGWLVLGGPGLAALTAGLAVARLLSPRPPRLELFRQPGFVAACVALALTARRFSEGILVDWMIGYDDWFLAMEWDETMREASLGILVAWPALALAGCLRAEPGWVDRALRALAILWVLMGVASRLVPLIIWAWFDQS